MANQTINIGTTANDGTGDQLRGYAKQHRQQTARGYRAMLLA